MCATVELESRGRWTRVFVGLFQTTSAARRYGEALVERGIVSEFLIRKADLSQAVTRPRRVTVKDQETPAYTTRSALIAKPAAPHSDQQTALIGSANNGVRKNLSLPARHTTSLAEIVRSVDKTLPMLKAKPVELVPGLDTALIPRPDPVSLAFTLVAGEVCSAPGPLGRRGGLWISGETGEALARLKWIVGDENAELIKLDADGHLTFDMRLLAKAAGLGKTRVEDPLPAIDYITSNEGLLLLVQIAQGSYRYLLHIGRQAPTSGKHVETSGSINLDNNADSRINPYRKNGKKLDSERPPEGFDSLIALNPVARWFNLSTNCWVQSGEIVFHELAEAYGKLEFGLDYLDHGSRTGAHARALERELRLKSQRPDVAITMTAGSNRLLRTAEEIRIFTAEAAGVSQR